MQTKSAQGAHRFNQIMRDEKKGKKRKIFSHKNFLSLGLRRAKPLALGGAGAGGYLSIISHKRMGVSGQVPCLMLFSDIPGGGHVSKISVNLIPC